MAADTQGMGRTGSVMAWIERQLEALSSRDRKLLMGLVCAGVTIGLVMLWYSLYSVLDSKASRVRAAKTNLAQISQMSADYNIAATKLAAQENRLREYASKPVSAHIEELATAQGILDSLRTVNETNSETVGNFKQISYQVELKGVGYEPAMAFLHALETSGYPASVETAEFQSTTVKREKKLNLNLELVVFRLAGG